MELLSRYKDVKFPLGTGNSLNEAYERARTNPSPPEADLVNGPERKLLVSLCAELQKQAGNNPFFISTRDCGRLLSRPWNTMATWLNAFTVLGIITPVEKAKRSTFRATRFRYNFKGPQ